MKNFQNKWIWITLVTAFLLRLPGVFDGLPAVFNSTEYFLAKTALSMAARMSPDPQVYIYPAFYYYFLVMVYGIYYLLGSLAGAFADAYDFAVQFLVSPSPFYFIARILNTLVSVATVYLLYRKLRKPLGENSTLIAAAGAGLCTMFIQYSGFATADTWLVFFSTLAALFIFSAIHSHKITDVFWAAGFAGLAIGVKYNAGFWGGAVLVAAWQLSNPEKRINNALLALAAVLAGFIVSNPLWLVMPAKFIDGYLLIADQMRSAASDERGINYLWEIFTLLKTEWLLGGAFLAASGYMLYRKPKKYLPLHVVLWFTFLYVGSWQKKGLDYLLPVFPVLIIFLAAGYGMMKSRAKTMLLYGTLILALLNGVWHGARSINTDTREQATEWIIQNGNPREPICYDNYHYDLGIFDIDRFTNYGEGAAVLPPEVKRRLSAFSDDPRNFSMVSILYETEVKTVNGENRYSRQAARYRRKTLRQLQEEGVVWLITNGRYYSAFEDLQLEEYPPEVQTHIRDVQLFRSALHASFQPKIVFEPDWLIPGPRIAVYRIGR